MALPAMKRLETLYVHNIDLHYHAGQERPAGTTLAGHLEHATLTGRTVLGCTDHLERYLCLPRPSAGPPLYERSVAGLQAYRADVDRLRGQFPALTLFFGPEVHAGPRIDLEQIPQGVVDVSDYFLSSLPTIKDSIGANTEARIARVRALAEMRERTGKPIFVAHPFRAAVNQRLVRHPIAPWVTAVAPRAPERFTDDELNVFFGFDVRALGRACSEYGVPLEVNGGTDGRIRGLNLPAPLQMLWASYLVFKQEGATFVPGSDQHAYVRNPRRREGRYVPFEAFAVMGLAAQDLVFVGELLERGAQ
jgi:hypothetical protein